MKSTLTLFLAVATITLGGVCVMQTRKFAGQQTQLVTLRTELDDKAQQVETLQASQKRSDQQRHELMSQAEEMAAELTARQAAETNANVAVVAQPSPPPVSKVEKPDDEKGGFGKMLSKMMQDPDTRKFIHDQQRLMMDQMYAPLVKQMGMTPDEATKFKDLLADNTMKGAEAATSLMGGGGQRDGSQLELVRDQQPNAWRPGRRFWQRRALQGWPRHIVSERHKHLHWQLRSEERRVGKECRFRGFPLSG